MTTIQTPQLMSTQHIDKEWSVFPSWMPIPEAGLLPVNSFLLKGPEPLLVDTGLPMLGDDFMKALSSEIDLVDLKWVWLSHMDTDHIGNLARVLKEAPNAQLITNFLGLGKLNLAGFDVSRVHLLQPGDVFESAGRRLIPIQPPYYDAPETIGFYDCQSEVMFVSDSFGALLEAPVNRAEEIDSEALKAGIVGWSSIDAPWLRLADKRQLGKSLNAINQLSPSTLLSAHLPVAKSNINALTGAIASEYVLNKYSPSNPLLIETIDKHNSNHQTL
jgi:flavorubredoxin